MKRFPLFILLLSLIGCAGAPVAQDPMKLPANNANGSNVVRLLAQSLERGDTVNVSVESIVSYDGMSAGYRPEDYGCENDSDAIVETEKFFLKEALGKHGHFSVAGGSTAPVVPSAAGEGNVAVSTADANAVAVSSAVAPAADVVTHRVVIEVQNHFSRTSGTTVRYYIEKRQLQDIRDDRVLAADRFADSNEVEYRPSFQREVAIGIENTSPFSSARRNAPPESGMKADRGMIDAGAAVEASRSPETTASTRSGIIRTSSGPGKALPIPAGQLVRVMRHRFPGMHGKSDQEVLDRFFALCSEDRNRISVASPER